MATLDHGGRDQASREGRRQGGVRLPTRKVCRWRDGKMVLRWAAALLMKNLRKIMGYCYLWMLEASLKKKDRNSEKGGVK